LKTPAVAKKFVDWLPIVDVPTEYIVFKPLAKLSDAETPKVVVFLVNPDQLSALVVLANYARGTDESETPKAVIGLTDITVRAKFDKDILSFTVPYKMFSEMESNVEGSFLGKHEWLKILERNK
jgi:uncharacterized protein (DUF169 family)